MPTLATPADRPDMLARRTVAALAMAAALAAPAWSGGALRAQTVGIDAVRQPPAPDTGFLRMGTNVAPGGH
ncbi:MAG TPA: hypothetical protein VMT77_10295, partial [Gemmatimonadales bacterium]|nr:hypothetical protein [Gemmatimonadales bacterium]